MNVLLITMAWPKYNEFNLYTDLMQEFIEHGHQSFVVAINEKTNRQKTYLSCEDNIQVLRVKSRKDKNNNKYCKVINSFLSGPQILYGIFRFLKKQKYDLILFSTPSIILTPCIIFLKKKHHAKLYLLLKDIWPQVAVDLGAMRKNRISWIVFRLLEKTIYKNSDYIGCMSPANVQYINRNNQYLNNKIVEVCPNSEKLRDYHMVERDFIREKYGLPKDKIIFVYGGNLGKVQGVDFLIDIIRYHEKTPSIFFLVVGSGTEYNYLYKDINRNNYSNAKIIPWITKCDFIDLIQICDVGLILLNKNSTVPNFPSRFLTYLAAKIPIIAAVDKVTDIGDVIEEANCGAKAFNGDINSFNRAVEKIIASEENRKIMGQNGYKLLLEKYTTKKSYETIIQHFIE